VAAGEETSAIPLIAAWWKEHAKAPRHPNLPVIFRVKAREEIPAHRWNENSGEKNQSFHGGVSFCGNHLVPVPKSVF
jgi:hypothetical protein